LGDFLTNSSGHPNRDRGDKVIQQSARVGTGLPDGLFSNQKNNLGNCWRALDWKMLTYIFYGQLEYFMKIGDIL
jgi:hypothetical protein